MSDGNRDNPYAWQKREPCLELFIYTGDTEDSPHELNRCGMYKGHDGSHSWRGDCQVGGSVKEYVLFKKI